jgi:GGDEF domain-containing protein
VRAQPLDIGAHQLQLGVSIGIAEIRPGDSAEDVLGRADAAMYAIKAATG